MENWRISAEDKVLNCSNTSCNLSIGYTPRAALFFTLVPNLDANVSAVAVGHIRIENEGGERDENV